VITVKFETTTPTGVVRERELIMSRVVDDHDGPLKELTDAEQIARGVNVANLAVGKLGKFQNPDMTIAWELVTRAWVERSFPPPPVEIVHEARAWPTV